MSCFYSRKMLIKLDFFCDRLALQRQYDVKHFLASTCNAAEAMKFSFKNSFCKCEQIHKKFLQKILSGGLSYCNKEIR